MKSSNKSENIVVVGNGIAAKCVVYFLNREGFNNITLIADDTKAPACSTRTTSTNCLRGTKQGLSDLGDLILKSYSDFELFFNQNTPDGISKSIETHATPTNTDNLSKWNRRYAKYDKTARFSFFPKSFEHNYYFIDNEAYFIFPEIFFSWFDQKLNFDFKKGFVVGVENKEVLTESGERFKFDKLVLCTSYLTQNLKSLVTADLSIKLEKSKPVPGTYLSFPISLFNSSQIALDKDYCFRIDDIHLLVRPTAGDVLLGSTSTSNSLDTSHNKLEIKVMYDRLVEHMEGVLVLPSFDQGELITGIRHKGHARRPFWGEVNQDIFAVWGLYKNAYTFAFTAGEMIAKLISSSKE